MQKTLPRVEVYRQARMIFVRQLIDIGRLSINVAAHHIHVKGRLDRLPGVSAPLTPACVHEMFAAIGRIPGISRVNGEFENWKLVDEAGQVWVDTFATQTSTSGVPVGAANTYVFQKLPPDPSPPG